MDKIQHVLNIQRQAWRNGHENYGAHIDVLAAIKFYLEYFKHLNPAQKTLLDELNQVEELKFAKKLCSRAQKSVRHIVVTYK